MKERRFGAAIFAEFAETNNLLRAVQCQAAWLKNLKNQYDGGKTRVHCSTRLPRRCSCCSKVLFWSLGLHQELGIVLQFVNEGFLVWGSISRLEAKDSIR